MKSKKLIFTILSLCLIAILGIVFHWENTPSDSIQQKVADTQVQSDSEENTISQAIANTSDPDAKRTSQEYDYLQEVYGLLPYFSNETLDLIGAEDPKQKVAINNLVEETFYAILDTIVHSGDVIEAENTTIVSAPPFNAQTRNKLILDYYSGLESNLGSEDYNRLTELNLTEHLHHKMLYFGEGPISITLNHETDDHVSVSIVTSLNNFGANELHSVNKLVGSKAFEANFPTLANLIQ